MYSIGGWNNDARSIAVGIRGSLIGHRSSVDTSRAETGDRDEERREDPLCGSLVVRDANKAESRCPEHLAVSIRSTRAHFISSKIKDAKA